MPNFFRQRSDRPLRYYIYISQTKLDILLPQIPPRQLAALEAEVRVNLGPVSAGVRKAASDPSPELAAKVGVLSDYLGKQPGWVGTVTEPSQFVRGIAPLSHGVMRDYAAELAVFAGIVDGVRLALIGSPDSLIGAADTAANHSLNYYVLRFLSADAEIARSTGEGQEYAAAVSEALRPGVLPSTGHNLEFLAKVIFHDGDVLVATPIYVALAS